MDEKLSLSIWQRSGVHEISI